VPRDPSCATALLHGSAFGSISSALPRQARAFTWVPTPQEQALFVRLGSLGVSSACFFLFKSFKFLCGFLGELLQREAGIALESPD
jgi:hypothetical protein